MTIDWAALGIVAVVSIVATIVFVALLSAGIKLVSQASVTTQTTANRAAGIRTAGYSLLGLAGLVVLFGLFLIVPVFR